MLYPEGGHVGMSAVEDSAGIARYAITSYSFTDASKGIVWIDGAVQFPASDLELKHVLKVFLNGNCLFSKEILGGFKGALGLQVKVGRVKKGDRLYVATGAINVKKLTRANAWFRLNFDISDYAAHETPAPTANFYYQESTDSVPQMKARGKAFSEKFEKQCEFNLRNRPDIIFLGDSITEYYSQSDSWKDINDAYNVSNCGIGWDATQNVIWRLENGGFEKLNPKLVVLLIGTNTIGIYGHDEQEVPAAGDIAARPFHE
jgi:hypothetical protein